MDPIRLFREGILSFHYHGLSASDELIQMLDEAADQPTIDATTSTVAAGPGNAGSLIPPFEYHTIKNSLADDTSVTIHVYGQELTQCSIFEPEDDVWFVRHTRMMTYDN